MKETQRKQELNSLTEKIERLQKQFEDIQTSVVKNSGNNIVSNESVNSNSKLR